MNQDIQPEALRLADECEESATNWLHEIDTRAKAAKMLRHLHAESGQHLQEMRSYRITVENREARIAELETELVKGAARTADYKQRYEQINQQHSMLAARYAAHGITQEKQG